MNEKEIIAEIKKNSSHAFKELVESYKDSVVNTCYGFLLNREDAEDIAQDVFIEVYFSIQSFRGDAQLSTWLYRISVNKSLNYLKKKKRLKWVGSFSGTPGSEKQLELPAIDSTSNPQKDLEQAERVKILQKAIESLANNQKISFTLSKYEDLSYKQIAAVMGITIPAVESLLNRAKKNLQKKLFSYYKSQ